jgi:hypothetical protein
MRHETRPVTVRTRWLTIGEGGMSSPPPCAAEVLERASVKFGLHSPEAGSFQFSQMPAMPNGAP